MSARSVESTVCDSGRLQPKVLTWNSYRQSLPLCTTSKHRKRECCPWPNFGWIGGSWESHTDWVLRYRSSEWEGTLSVQCDHFTNGYHSGCYTISKKARRLNLDLDSRLQMGPIVFAGSSQLSIAPLGPFWYKLSAGIAVLYWFPVAVLSSSWQVVEAKCDILTCACNYVDESPVVLN